MFKLLWILNGKTVGVLGIAFKPNTDDIRSAPAIDIIKMMQKEGAKIKAYDPEAVDKAKTILSNVQYCKDPCETIKGSDALVIITEWEEFRNLKLGRVKKLLKYPIVSDGRNIFGPKKMKKLGFKYTSIGRPDEN